MDIKSILGKINDINMGEVIQSIRQFDWKNIDYQKVKETLKSRPDLFIIVIAAVLSVLVILNSVTRKATTVGRIKKEMKLMNKKLDVVKQRNTAESNYDEFIEEFPDSIQSDSFIDEISEIASKYNLQIQSFSPAQEKESEYSTVIVVKIILHSEDFEKLIDFVQDVEQSTYAIRMERLVSKLSTANSRRRRSESEKNLIEAQIDIASITLN